MDGCVVAILNVEPGDTILESHFTDSWTAVRSVVNAQTNATVRRDCFGRQHLPRIMAGLTGSVRARQLVSTTTPATISAAHVSAVGDAVSSSYIRTNWTQVLNANGSGAGFALAGNCHILVMATVFVQSFASVDEDAAAFMAVTRSIDGGSHAMEDDSDWRFIMHDDEETRAFPGTVTIDDVETIRKRMTMWTVIDGPSTPFTLTSVKLWVARERGVAVNWTLGNASMALYGFYTG